ncbi:hypothetical protein CYK37_11465 [Mesorhizobium loti]|nr:DUF6640 family protein [Mesorhizobium loti]PLP59102.1 hypothetical protein CYK37_11465 [Mesorhizobium loti]
MTGGRLTARILVSVVAIFTAVAAHVADWSASHVFNESWPPHAKFHNGQTLALSILASLACLWFAWRRQGDERTNALAAIVLASLYWITQAVAILYPGTAFFDAAFDDPALYLAGLPIQGVIEISVFTILGIAVWLWSAPLAGSPSSNIRP